MSPENLSRRAIIAGAAALPALAVPALSPTDATAEPVIESREAMVMRAKRAVDLHGSCYIREGWALDKDRAAAFVDSVARFDEKDGNCPHCRAVLK